MINDDIVKNVELINKLPGLSKVKKEVKSLVHKVAHRPKEPTRTTEQLNKK